jgi:hypothetical protein
LLFHDLLSFRLGVQRASEPLPEGSLPVAETRMSRLGEGVFARVERGPAGGRTGHYFGCGFRVVYVSLMPPDCSFHRQWRNQNGLKSFRSFRRGGARRMNID